MSQYLQEKKDDRKTDLSKRENDIIENKRKILKEVLGEAYSHFEIKIPTTPQHLIGVLILAGHNDLIIETNVNTYCFYVKGNSGHKVFENFYDALIYAEKPPQPESWQKSVMDKIKKWIK